MMRGSGPLSTTQDGRHIPAPRREVPPSADLEQSLRLHLAQACAHFASATVRQFLPILVEREVRRRLAAQ